MQIFGERQGFGGVIVGDLVGGTVKIGEKMIRLGKNRHSQRYIALFSGVLRREGFKS